MKRTGSLSHAALCLVGAVAFSVAGTATESLAQSQPLQSWDVPVEVRSGEILNPGSTPLEAWRAIVSVPDAPWIRLRFKTANLGEDPRTGTSSTLRITSLQDGSVQFLDAVSVRQWRNTSAYFNGNGVEVTLIAAPNGRRNEVEVDAVVAGIPESGGSLARSICGPADDRLPSTDPRQGRGVPIGCSTWLINDVAKCFLTAGHCMTDGLLNVVEFQVPFSDSNGNIQHPGPDDQYSVDPASNQFTDGGVGDDWGTFGCFPNSNTGLTPFEAQGMAYSLSAGAPPVSGQDIRITGYGTMPSPPEWNQIQKTHVGPYSELIGTALSYATDTTGGNSGSPVFNEDTAEAIGIHTHAGCDATSGANYGTAIDHPNLQNALANPQGVCAFGLNFDYPAGFPTIVVADQISSLEVDVTGQGVTLEAGTVLLHTDTGGGFVSQSMTANGPSLYEGTLPSVPCGDVFLFYLSALTTDAREFRDPPGAPGTSYRSVAAPAVRPLFLQDDFESDMGWTVVNANLTDGAWTRGTPIGGGDRGDPPADFDGSGQCFLTDNVDGNSDVDNGPTRLLSPVFALGIKDALISYATWHSSDTGDDDLLVEISNDNGSSWTLVQSISSIPGWREHSFVVSSLIAPSNEMQLRFSVADTPNNSITESGVDAVQIELINCDGGNDAPDLAVTDIQIDYDPGTSPVDAGPGALGQAVNAIVTVRNDGNIPVSSANVTVDASVVGEALRSQSLVVTDFDAAAGTQTLDPGQTFDVVFSFAAGELDRCGTYSVFASHDASSLASQGGGGSLIGDGDNTNDCIADYPDDQGNPGDAFSPDLLELDLGNLDIAIRPESEVIEDVATEKLRVSIDFTGLGPGGDSNDVSLIVDITDGHGAVLARAVFSRSRSGVGSAASASIVLRVDLGGLGLATGVVHRVRMRLFDTNSNEVCIESLTPGSFVVQ